MTFLLIRLENMGRNPHRLVHFLLILISLVEVVCGYFFYLEKDVQGLQQFYKKRYVFQATQQRLAKVNQCIKDTTSKLNKTKLDMLLLGNEKLLAGLLLHKNPAVKNSHYTWNINEIQLVGFIHIGKAFFALLKRNQGEIATFRQKEWLENGAAKVFEITNNHITFVKTIRTYNRVGERYITLTLKNKRE